MTSDGITAALIQLQADLPYVTKTAQAQYGKYADLAHVSRIIMPRLAELGLAFTACPTMTDDGKFVLEYRLEHFSGEFRGGSYPLGTGNPQQLGSAITYARRYCLLAVTGVAPDEDDDDGQTASAYFPETRADGSATEAEQVRMATGRVPGAWRATSTAENDQWYDMPPAEPRDYDSPGTITPDQLKALHAKYAVAGIRTRPAQLAKTMEWLGLSALESHRDLSQRQGRDLLSRLEKETTVKA